MLKCSTIRGEITARLILRMKDRMTLQQYTSTVYAGRIADTDPTEFRFRQARIILKNWNAVSR